MRRLLSATAVALALAAWAAASAFAVPPVVDGPALTADTTPTFTIAGDPGLECSLVLAGAADTWQACAAGPFTPATPLADGAYVLAARSLDATVTRSFTVDATAPAAPAVDAPLEGSTVTGSALFAFRSDPAAALTCSLDGGPYVPCAPGATFAFATDGPHALRLRSADAAGNVSESALRRFAVDATAPVVTVISPGEGATTARTVQFDFAASEPGVTYRCRVNLGSVFPCTPGYARANLAPGARRFSVGATDAVGNVGPMTVRRFNVAPGAEDEQAPEPDPDDAAAGAGATPAALAALRIGGLSSRRVVRRARLRREGLRVGFAPPAGMTVARVRVLRGGRTVFTTVRTVRRGSRVVLALRSRAIGRLRPGRYRVEVRAGLSRTQLGPPARRSFRIVR